MSALVIADTHFTDRAADEYRWPLFQWLKDTVREHNVKEVIHCGDLTDAKDHHSAKLVNRLFDCLNTLSGMVKVYLLRGNHDGIDPRTPFFRFLSATPGLYYAFDPVVLELSIGKATFVPSGMDWNTFQLHQLPFTFAHATFDGSIAENGRLLPGIKPSLLARYEGRVISGDIHVPQKIGGNIEYVGAPYHIRFGDDFDPRVMLIRDDGGIESLYFPAPRKHVVAIRSLDELPGLNIPEGDQVKIRVHLGRETYHEWKTWQDVTRLYAKDERGWELAGMELLPLETTPEPGQPAAAGMTPDELIEAYARKHGVGDDYIAFAKEMMK